MGRNALDALGQQITGCSMSDVTQTDDADHPLALVHHRQPAELQLLHVMHRLCEVIVLPATMDAFGHHIARHRAASGFLWRRSLMIPRLIRSFVRRVPKTSGSISRFRVNNS